MRFNLIVIFLVFVVMAGACPAFSQMTSAERNEAYEAYINDFILKCEQKNSMMDSMSENIRGEVVTSLMKANFYKKNKELLIQDLAKNNVEPKPYKIEYFLNKKFFAIVRDHDPKVAEAYSEPDEIVIPAPDK